MGSLLTRLNSFLSIKSKKILIIGLNSVGKTTLLYTMKLKEKVDTVPTIGFNVETIKYQNMNLIVWDVGYGSFHARKLWKHYFQETDAVIYVIDCSSDSDLFELNRQNLQQVILDQSLINVPFLILANKMDLASIEVQKIIELLELKKIKQNWHIQKCCALDGRGIYEGFSWLKSNLV